LFKGTPRVVPDKTNGKEYIVAYESRRLLDAETRYTFIEKLCLSLYYACTKLRHYLLSSTCYVASQTDIIKYMLQKLFLVIESASGLMLLLSMICVVNLLDQ
jgi:hypothetical protein